MKRSITCHRKLIWQIVDELWNTSGMFHQHYGDPAIPSHRSCEVKQNTIVEVNRKQFGLTYLLNLISVYSRCVVIPRGF